METYRFSELIDLNILQRMADAQYRSAGMPIGIIDAFDDSILVGAGWQEICLIFHRANPQTRKLCNESDNFIKDHLAAGVACPYKCRNGLYDIGMPIIVEGNHLATLFLGQFFYEGEVPDRDFFRAQAAKYGFDQQSYLAALDRVPVFSEQKVRYIIEYDKALVAFLEDLASQSIHRLKKEEEIRVAERKFQALFHNTDIFQGLLMADGTMIEVNQPALDFAGVKRSNVIGRRFWDTPWWENDPEQQEMVRMAVARAAEGETVSLETTLTSLSGTLEYFDGSIKPVFDREGKVEYLIPEGRNVTAKKLADIEKMNLLSQLSQSQKMESIGRLAGGVAHDFNNMLGVIIGNIDLAQIKLPPDNPAAHNLAEVRTAAEHSSDLTRQLLAFARKQTVEPESIDLNKVVENTLKMLRRLVDEHIEISWKPAPDLWTTMVDPTQMDQILVNLTTNSRDAIDQEDGLITIETANITADLAYCAVHIGMSPGEYVMLSVSDNGCGMERELIDNIFEPFFTTKESCGGTGLGLATVYGIVKQNGGTVNVYSEPGRGSTFKIILPRWSGAEGMARTHIESHGWCGGTETILLVEDEQLLLDLSREILEKLGYRVLASSSPAAAIAMAKEFADRIDLLITDVVMPEMNGRVLAQTINEIRPGGKFLYMSGYPSDVIGQHGVLEEGVQFIQKPFTMQALAEKVRNILDLS